MHFDTVKAVPGHLLGGVARLDIFNPHPPLSYIVIIRHTSRWCLFDDVILEQALQHSCPVCCGFLSAKHTYKP